MICLAELEDRGRFCHGKQKESQRTSCFPELETNQRSKHKELVISNYLLAIHQELWDSFSQNGIFVDKVQYL